MTSLMNSLLGYSSEIDNKYQQCREQIKSLVQRIKKKNEEKDDEILTKFNEKYNKIVVYENEHESKHQATKPGSSTPDDIPLKLRPSNGALNRLNAGFNLQKTLKGHTEKIYALQWSSDSRSLVSASQDGSLIIWDMTNKSYKKLLGIPLRMAWVMTVTYSPNGEYVASGGLDNLCSVFNIKDQIGWATGATPHRELQQHEGYVSCCKFVNNTHILTASGDSTCILWDIEYQQPVQCFIGHTGDVDSVAHNSKTKNIFVSGSIDCTAKIWDYRQSKSMNTFNGHVSDVNCVKWFPDYNSFGTAGDDGSCRLYDLKSYQTLNVYGHKMNEAYGVTSIDFSKSGYYLCSAYDDGPMCVAWNTVTAKEEKILAHEQRVSSLEFSPNGKCLATASWDRNLRVWV